MITRAGLGDAPTRRSGGWRIDCGSGEDRRPLERGSDYRTVERGGSVTKFGQVGRKERVSHSLHRLRGILIHRLRKR